jgi:hypothetical protein
MIELPSTSAQRGPIQGCPNFYQTITAKVKQYSQLLV